MNNALYELAISIHIAGGRICCPRCQAMSKRTKQQCGAPAERGKRVCRFHGARSTGPTTAEGRLRIARSKIKNGNETRQARKERSRKAAELAQIEDIMHLTSMTNATRTRGRKPSGYRPIKTMQQAVDFVIGRLSKSGTTVKQASKKNSSLDLLNRAKIFSHRGARKI